MCTSWLTKFGDGILIVLELEIRWSQRRKQFSVARSLESLGQSVRPVGQDRGARQFATAATLHIYPALPQ